MGNIMIKKLLIANRGEIAVRIATVAVYSRADKDALHVKLADESICIGEALAKESYLKMERILCATIASGADAIHPGFGFLAENAKFANLCRKCNITFVGPDGAWATNPQRVIPWQRRAFRWFREHQSQYLTQNLADN